MTTRETETGVPVTEAEVAEVLDNFRPGQVVPSFEIFLAYDRLMKEYRQPLASRVALGRALTAAGCEKVRKQKRVAGKKEETHCWRIAVPPGYSVDAEDDRQARAVIEHVGPGIHSNSSLHEAYARLASEHRWRGRMSQGELMRALNRLGVHRMTDRGQPSRFIPDNSAPAPKAVPRPVPRVDFEEPTS
jgi:hypothetical protein